MYGKIASGTSTAAGGGVLSAAAWNSAGVIVTTLVLIFAGLAVLKLLPDLKVPRSWIGGLRLRPGVMPRLPVRLAARLSRRPGAPRAVGEPS
jgi:hypothetical protein